MLPCLPVSFRILSCVEVWLKQSGRKSSAHVVNNTFTGLRSLKLRIEDPPNRKTSVFQGASVLGEIMKDRMDFWQTKDAYQEGGVDYIHMKITGRE